MHVGIKAGAADDHRTDTDNRYHENHRYQQSILVEGVGVNAVDPLEMRRTDVDRQHLWQVNQREQRGAKDGESGKQPEVAQQVGLDKQQSGKTADGGQTA